MSIKADRWIIRKSTLPTHFQYVVEDGSYRFAWASVDFPFPYNTTDLDVSFYPTFGAPGAKSGNWHVMDERALEWFHANNPWFPMIDKFEPNQVRKGVKTRDLTHEEELKQRGMSADEREAYFATLNLNEKAISYGTSSYGYDVRCSNKFKIFTNINNQVIDPKAFNDNIFVDFEGPICTIPPNSFALASTVEWFKIPRNVLTICLGKSTYARCGIIVNVTPLEPEWEGHVTLEFSNTTTLPAKIYAGEGVAQMLFLESDEEPLVSYKDRDGKYQGQSGVTLPRG